MVRNYKYLLRYLTEMQKMREAEMPIKKKKKREAPKRKCEILPTALLMYKTKILIEKAEEWMPVYFHKRYNHECYYIEENVMKAFAMYCSFYGVKLRETENNSHVYECDEFPNRKFRKFPIKTKDGIKELYSITPLLVAIGETSEDDDEREFVRL